MESSRSRRFVVAVALASCATLLAGTQAGQDRNPAGRDEARVVETQGEWAARGFDPEQRRSQIIDNYLWLSSERAGLPASPGISVSLAREDRRNIGEEPCDDCDGRTLLRPGKLRVGVVKTVAPPVVFESLTRASIAKSESFARGGLRAMNDGFVWTLEVESPGASALRVQLDRFSLPVGAELHIFTDYGEAYGPYVNRGPDGDGVFWTESVSGDRAYIQLRYFGTLDARELASIRFRIPAVGHLGRHAANARPPRVETQASNLCSFNADCVVNASCANIPAAIQPATDAVAHMQWISGAFIYICTGGLLADTDTSTQVPLFLTANHCLSRGKDAKNLEAFFRFVTSCNNPSCPQPFTDPPGVPKVVGATILSTGSTGDYTLMRLNQNPPSGSYFMGWTSAPIAFTSGAALHRFSHPGGAPQAYSQHAVNTSAGTCINTARGNWIYSRDVVGATEGGSSGSPVMNASGQVVGQLTGACGTNTGNTCDNVNNATIDGALASYFSSVEPYLDPAGGPPPGSCDNDGTCESGEDCTNCGDCPGRQNGPPSGRYCCGNGILEGPESTSFCNGNI